MHHDDDDPDVWVEELGVCEIEVAGWAEGDHVDAEDDFSSVPLEGFEFLTEYLVLFVLFAFALLADDEGWEDAGEVDWDNDVADSHSSLPDVVEVGAGEGSYVLSD